jgi:hypothetical protein
MIEHQNYEADHIEELHKRYPEITQEVLEMTMYAACLLQALIDSGLDFIFKGGTCLLFLLKEPRRVSTDIDILVEPGTNILPSLEKIRKHYPFTTVSSLTDKNSIIRHFAYPVPRIYGNRKFSIRLDVLAEHNPYVKVEHIPLRSPLLITSGIDSSVKIPSIECLLADKLTAFAPKTIGVNPEKTSAGFPTNNHLQVIKQLFDVGTLFEYAHDYAVLKETYSTIAHSESSFRGGAVSEKDALRDSFEAALSIATEGSFDAKSFQTVYKNGIASLNDHVFQGGFNLVNAKQYAAKVMLLSAGLFRNVDTLNCSIPRQGGFTKSPYNAIKKIRNKDDFDRAAFAIRMFDEKAD